MPNFQARIEIYNTGEVYVAKYERGSIKYELKISSDLAPVSTSDEIRIMVPPDMDGWYLVEAQAFVGTAPTGSGVTFKGIIVDGGQTILDEITIPVGDKVSPLASSTSDLRSQGFGHEVILKFYITATDSGNSAKGAGLYLEFCDYDPTVLL